MNIKARALTKLFLFVITICAISVIAPAHSSAQVVPIQELDVSIYAPGTFFSVVFDKRNPNLVYAGPSQGAAYADGRPVESSKLVDHYGGHVQVRAGAYKQMSSIRKAVSDFAGGGFKLGENGELTFSYTSRSMNGGNGKLSPALQATIRRTVTDNIGRGFALKTDSMSALSRGSANCLKAGVGAAGNILGIAEVIGDAYLNTKHEEELKLLQSSPCPVSANDRSDIYWNNFYSEDTEATAARIAKCDEAAAAETNSASNAFRDRLMDKLKGRFANTVIGCNGDGVKLGMNDGTYSTMPQLSFTSFKSGPDAYGVSIDNKRNVTYTIGTSHWSEPMSQFEKRVACQTDPQACPRDVSLPMFDDQLGTDAKHPFGTYYDGGGISDAYLKLKNLYLLKQVDNQTRDESLTCGELRTLAD